MYESQRQQQNPSNWAFQEDLSDMLNCIQVDRHFNIPRLLAFPVLVICAENRRFAC
jgi:hypothetical protein